VHEAGALAGAAAFFVWASIDLPAMASYLKIGMLPGTQVLTFEGSPHVPADAPGYELAAFDAAFAASLDERLLEMPRPQDHAHWQHLGMGRHSVTQHGAPVGYFYLREGHVGPLAWTEPQHAAALLDCAIRLARQTSSTVRLRVPGMNHTAIDYALGAGFMLLGYSHLLVSRPIGQWQNYLPSGPGLF
jgi:hypothetical protein